MKCGCVWEVRTNGFFFKGGVPGWGRDLSGSSFFLCGGGAGPLFVVVSGAPALFCFDGGAGPLFLGTARQG